MALVLIGVDPHKASHTAVAIDQSEGSLAELKVRSSVGYLAIGTGESRHDVEWAVSRMSEDRKTPTVPLSPGKQTG